MGLAILLVRLGCPSSRPLSSIMACTARTSTDATCTTSCLRCTNNFLRPPSPAYGLLFLLFEGVSLSLSLEELIYLLAWPRRGLSSRLSRFMRTSARAFFRAWKSPGRGTSTLLDPRWEGMRGVRYLSSSCSAISAAFVGWRPETDGSKQGVRQQRRALTVGGMRAKDKGRMRSIAGRVLLMRPITPRRKRVGDRKS